MSAEKWEPCIEIDQDDDAVDVVQPKLTIDNAIDHLNEVQKLFVDNDATFTQINALYSAVTSSKIKSEIVKKNKQATITDFFNVRQNE